ncbi:MAG: SGNH/GDSL hydrolase family protein [Clostridiales bacterium]|nr:SGNH/GDSL hydrolase family protein [Clostridiales bacterium]
MRDISKIDGNFKIKTDISRDGLRFYDVDSPPFALYGVRRENGKYRRMPESVAKSVSEGVYLLHTNTAGGRVRFVTDSPYIAIHAEMEQVGKMPHFALTGSAGFDMYDGNDYVASFIPPFDLKKGYESVVDPGGGRQREITVDLPLYSDVKALFIGLKDGCILKEPAPYKNKKPAVYYGSSITQGGCASRPGMSYQAVVSRALGIDYVNLGFSGSAKAEDEMIDYVKNLDMSVFVYDYDHNAPTAEHLEKTHEKMFRAIREKQPDLPVIMMPRPKFRLTEDEKRRRDTVERTYLRALAAGDKNVYFIDSPALTALCRDEGTVDDCHPTDFGFASMAKALIGVLSGIDIR